MLILLVLAGTVFSQESEDLLLSTLSLDIETSDYYTLSAWCRRLGIDDSGSKTDLAERLRKYYSISPEPAKKSTGDRIITIESANRTDYFILEEIDESYVSLTGKVILLMEDRETGDVHRIEAESILLNEKQNTITAVGGVIYTLQSGGKSDIFRGEQLTFQVEDWEGLFVKGITEQTSEMDGEEITYLFAGETIKRFSDERILLDDGIITTSNLEEPCSSIRASKIWVLKPGEWAIKDAVYYVGRVPMFYLPFFFRPGDEVIFHPVAGYKDREGYYIQTTTYFLGQREDTSQEGLFSFLDVGVSEEPEPKERHGLFLQNAEHLSADEKKHHEWVTSSGSYGKVLIDYYSRLGFFAGIEVFIGNLGIIQHFDGSLGIGFTRELKQDPSNDYYSPSYFQNPDGTWSSRWNSSRLFGLEVPFRYGVDLSFLLKGGEMELSGQLPIYSDISFLEDLYDRTETLDWGNLIGINEETTAETSSTPETPLWKLSGKFIPKITAGIITQADISSIEASLLWNSRVFSADDPDDDFTFFYPSSYELPKFEAKLKGTLFSSSTGPSGVSGESPIPGIRPPWTDEEQEEEREEDESIFRLPEITGDEKLPPVKEHVPLDHSLSFSILPRFSVRSEMDSVDWKEPEDIDYAKAYSVISADGSSAINYQASWFDKILKVKDGVTFDGSYAQHYDPVSPWPLDWLGLLENDKDLTNFTIKNSLGITSYPLQDDPFFSSSNLSYSLNTTLFNYSYSDLTETFGNSPFDWDQDITSHSLKGILAFSLPRWSHDLSVSSTLPPLDPEIDSSFSFKTGIFSAGVDLNLTFDEIQDKLELSPVTVFGKGQITPSNYLSVSFDIDPEGLAELGPNDPPKNSSTSILSLSGFEDTVVLKETFAYDFDRDTPRSSLTELTLGYFTASYLHKYTNRFIPDTLTAGVYYDYESEPLWKNRITWSTDISTAWKMNLQQYTDNSLQFKFGFDLSIFKFLDLSFNSVSTNKATYRYFPGMTECVGVKTLNIFEDLLKSFNFFNEDDRIESNFNIQSLEISATHHLCDWDLVFIYSGEPVVVEGTMVVEGPTGEKYDYEGKYYEWQSNFTILVRWNPLPEVKSSINYEDQVVTF